MKHRVETLHIGAIDIPFFNRFITTICASQSNTDHGCEVFQSESFELLASLMSSVY